MKDLVRKEVLLNAYLHNGKANVGSVMKKLMGNYPELREQSKEIMELVKQLVNEINQKNLEEITNILEKDYPDAIKNAETSKKEKKQQRKELPPLPKAEKGKVVLRYAPDPSKYPHIGHALNYMINELYREKYSGKAVLRFDDTNPQKVALEYYDAIKDGMQWVGCKWDKEVKASENLEHFYKLSEKLIKDGHFYVCTCRAEKIKEYREKMLECECRSRPINENLEMFKQMTEGKYSPGSAVIRLKGNMKSKNSVMRDPVMFRIVNPKQYPHPIVGDKYWLWPTYDFETSVMEKDLGITHVLRSAEFGKMRVELQSYLIKLLGGEPPIFHQYSRFNIIGAITKGREIRELVEKGIVDGWDDIRLVTISGLRKRGIVPEVIKDLILEIGITAKNAKITWEKIVAFNRRHLDATAPRLFAVLNPVPLEITNVSSREITLKYHPDNKKLGERTIKTSNEFYISKSDAEVLKQGETFRLKDLYNVKIIEITNEKIIAKYQSDELIPKTKKIQWVSKEHALELDYTIPLPLINKDGTINKNSLVKVKGYVEDNIKGFEIGSLFQLERIGFAKLNKMQEYVVYMHEIHK